MQRIDKATDVKFRIMNDIWNFQVSSKTMSFLARDVYYIAYQVEDYKRKALWHVRPAFVSVHNRTACFLNMYGEI